MGHFKALKGVVRDVVAQVPGDVAALRRARKGLREQVSVSLARQLRHKQVRHPSYTAGHTLGCVLVPPAASAEHCRLEGRWCKIAESHEVNLASMHIGDIFRHLKTFSGESLTEDLPCTELRTKQGRLTAPSNALQNKSRGV